MTSQHTVDPLLSGSASASAVADALAMLGGLGANGVNAGQIEISGRRANVVFRDQWLTIDLPARMSGRGPRRLLELNSNLLGAKHVLLVNGPVRLRAEIPIHDDMGHGSGDLHRLIRFAMAGLLDPSTKSRRGAPPNRDAGAAVESTGELAQFCEETGWPFSHRASGGLHVDLEVAGGDFYQAAVVPDRSCIRQTVHLLRDGESPADDVAELAVSVLLLAASACVRLVRGISRKTDHGRVFGLEVCLPASPSLDLFVDGLSGLSLACSLVGKEVRALAQDTALSRAFLQIRHPRFLKSHRIPKENRRSAGRAPAAEVVAR